MSALRTHLKPTLVMILLLFQTACGANAPQLEASPTVPPSVDAIPQPTPTALPPDVYLLITTGASVGFQIEAVAAFLEARAIEAGGEFRWEQGSIEPETIPSLTVLVLIEQAGQDQAWGSLNPQAQVMAIPGSSEERPENVTLLAVDRIEIEQLGFLAGYAAALLSPDWRTAVITQVDSSAGALLGPAFRQGAQYYCGLCRPERPPYEDYPLQISLDPDDASSWQRVIDTMITASIDVVYYEPGVLGEGQGQELLDEGMLLITSEADVGAWSPSLLIVFDPAGFLEENWSAFRAGELEGAYRLPILLRRGEDGAISSGRRNALEELRQDLEDGYIGIGS